MDNNINKQTNSSQASNKNTTNNNTNNNTNNITNNTTNTSQNNTSIDNCTSNNSHIITNDPNENLNHIIQTGIETAQNIQLNLSQNRVTYIKPLSTSNINITETTTAPGEAGAPSNINPTATSAPPSANPCENIFQNISETSALLQNINNIREQLAKLNIDPTQRIYYENCIVPLLTTLYELTASSATLATSVNFLAISPVVHPKTSQLRDTTHLVYNINEKCEDIYKVLKKRIDIMLDMC